MDTFEAVKLSDFIKIIESHDYVNDNTLFRGHNEESWKLEPKIARDSFKPRWKKDSERAMLETFKRLSKQFLSAELKNDWDYLALAQHHGMATRLLDWTTNPLTALWFCVSKPCKEKFGCVWMMKVEDDNYLKASQLEHKPQPSILHTEESLQSYLTATMYGSPFHIGSIIIFQPHLLDNRIIVQNGWFTAHGRDANDKYLELSENEIWQNRLVKIKIPQSSFSEIRSNLDTLGVNHLTLFPDLDGTAYYAEWLNMVLEDEPSEEG